MNNHYIIYVIHLLYLYSECGTPISLESELYNTISILLIKLCIVKVLSLYLLLSSHMHLLIITLVFGKNSVI